jgi:hypothetical protein
MNERMRTPPSETLIEVGGPPDQVSVSLYIYGTDIDLAALTARLGVRYEMGFGVFLESRNRGFDLSPALVRRLSDRGASFGCDIYAPDGATPVGE